MTTDTIETGTDIVALVNATPVLVLTDKAKFSQFYEAIKKETDALDADVSTEKGRKAIASMAYKVARTKTAIDDAGKKLNEEARAKISAVDESRREIRQQLDDLKDEVRAPLTKWEIAEKVREETAAQELSSIQNMQRVDIDDTVATVEDRLNALTAMTLQPSVHAAGFEDASNARASAMQTLDDALARLRREESDRAELERHRIAEQERQEREAAEKAERERIEAERRAAEEAEQRRQDAEKAEQERIARLEREAEERAKAEAERVAREEREAVERAHAEQMAAERRRAEEAEAAAQAERDRSAREEAARKAEAERVEAEQKAREADRAHRSKIMTAAKEAIMEAGSIDEPTAKNIVLAIVGGSIPHTRIQF